MHNVEDLRNIVYALTLIDRKTKRAVWATKGFKRVNERRNFLINYWDCRLQKEKPEDLELYNNTLKDFRTIMANSEKAKQEERLEASLPPEEIQQDAPLPLRPAPLQMLQNAGRAAANWVKSGFEGVDEITLQSRMDICKGCEFWDKLALNGTGRCKKCGCSTWAKLRMATESCPLEKWVAVNK
jgi:hypothetical protein